jgi:hypothetical protein
MAGGEFLLPEYLMPEMFQFQHMPTSSKLIYEFFNFLKQSSLGTPCLKGVIQLLSLTDQQIISQLPFQGGQKLHFSMNL